LSLVVLLAGAAGLVNCVADDPVVAPTPLDAGASTEAGVTPQPPGNDAAPDGAGPGTDAADAGDAGPVPTLDTAVAVTVGRQHSCALTAAQDVLCWGANTFDQLGRPATLLSRSSVPVKVDIGGKAIAVAAGHNHSCAILTSGEVRCWGKNDRGQLGRDTLVATGSVAAVQPPKADAEKPFWKEAELITAGGNFTCVGARSQGFSGLPSRRFFCWGENSTRQLGTERTNGQPLPTPTLITPQGNDDATGPSAEGFAISAGDDFACAGTWGAAGAAEFSVAGCWGNRSQGQVGAPAQPNAFILGAQQYPSFLTDGGKSLLIGLLKPQLVAAGGAHGCARFEQFNVSPMRMHCWGNNTLGQTGNSTSGVRPLEIMAGYDATNVTALAAGGENTCVIESGRVKCLGGNAKGQLGNGTIDTVAHATFVPATLPPTASAIAVGTTHSCAVLGGTAGSKGGVACWGDNELGQLGDGLDIEAGYPGASPDEKYLRSTPVRVLAPK
jgi:alpha-tubulin suppressor-like RCC1 family protein